MFLSAPDFMCKRCSTSPKQDVSNATSAVANLELSPNGSPSIKNNCKADQQLNDRASLETPYRHPSRGIRPGYLDIGVGGGLQKLKQKGNNGLLGLVTGPEHFSWDMEGHSSHHLGQD